MITTKKILPAITCRRLCATADLLLTFDFIIPCLLFNASSRSSQRRCLPTVNFLLMHSFLLVAYVTTTNIGWNMKVERERKVRLVTYKLIDTLNYFQSFSRSPMFEDKSFSLSLSPPFLLLGPIRRVVDRSEHLILLLLLLPLPKVCVIHMQIQIHKLTYGRYSRRIHRARATTSICVCISSCLSDLLKI